MLFRVFIRLSDNGLAYGAGFLDRAASQSNGVDDDMEGVSAGERRKPNETRLRGVEGPGAGLPELEATGEVETDADFEPGRGDVAVLPV